MTRMAVAARRSKPKASCARDRLAKRGKRVSEKLGTFNLLVLRGIQWRLVGKVAVPTLDEMHSNVGFGEMIKVGHHGWWMCLFPHMAQCVL